MRQDPVLLLVAKLPPEFRLSDLHNDISDSTIIFNNSKYADLEAVEVVINGMAFILTRYTSDETLNGFQATKAEHIFSKPLPSSSISIGITLSPNIIVAKHTPAINQALLTLAKILGSQIGAIAAIWLPAKLNIGFEYFTEAAEQYCNGGPFPALIQVAIAKKSSNLFQTSGLSYFSDQEVILQVPKAYATNDIIKRLIRIIHDVATNGKIDSKIEADGFIPGERLIFEPDESRKVVNASISGVAAKKLH